MKRFLKVLVLAAAAVTFIGCASTSTSRSFKEYWKDQTVGTKLRLKLMKDKEVKFSHMHVQMWKGMATLTGRAVSEYEKEKASQIAAAAKGVIGVKNYLDVVGQYEGTGENKVEEVKTVDEIKTTETVDVKKDGKKVVIKEETIKQEGGKTTKEKKKVELTAKQNAGANNKTVEATPVVNKGAAPAPTVAKKKKVTTPVKKEVATKKAPSEKVAAEKSIKSQHDAAKWYQNVNKAETTKIDLSKPTDTSKKELATRKEISAPAPTSAPENNLAREAAEELKRLRATDNSQ